MNLALQSLMQSIAAWGYTCTPEESGSGWLGHPSKGHFIPSRIYGLSVRMQEVEIASIRLEGCTVHLHACLVDKKEFLSYDEFAFTLLPRFSMLVQDPELLPKIQSFLAERATIHKNAIQ